MTEETNLLLFLKEQLEEVKKQITKRNYGSDLDELRILWDIYGAILSGIREVKRG